MMQQTQPALGKAVRDEWQLDWTKLTVNHGAFGATPIVVLDTQSAWRDKMEAQPSIFMRRIMPPALRASADALASFLNAQGQDVVFVDNATTGCNAVLRLARLSRRRRDRAAQPGLWRGRSTPCAMSRSVPARASSRWSCRFPRRTSRPSSSVSPRR